MGALLVFLLAFTDPYAPDTEAAAEAAVARLGPNRAVNIVPSILDIVGLQMGVVANVQGLQQAMRDLGAQETNLEITVDLFASEECFEAKPELRCQVHPQTPTLFITKCDHRIHAHCAPNRDERRNHRDQQQRAGYRKQRRKVVR